MMTDMGHPRRSAGRAVLRTGAVAALTVLVDRVLDGQHPRRRGTAPGGVGRAAGADRRRSRPARRAAPGPSSRARWVTCSPPTSSRHSSATSRARSSSASFESFTSGAASSAAVRHRRAHRSQRARRDRRTRHRARRPPLVPHASGDVHGGTAAVHFAFEATMEDGTTATTGPRRPLHARRRARHVVDLRLRRGARQRRRRRRGVDPMRRLLRAFTRLALLAGAALLVPTGRSTRRPSASRPSAPPRPSTPVRASCGCWRSGPRPPPARTSCRVAPTPSSSSASTGAPGTPWPSASPATCTSSCRTVARGSTPPSRRVARGRGRARWTTCSASSPTWSW